MCLWVGRIWRCPFSNLPEKAPLRTGSPRILKKELLCVCMLSCQKRSGVEILRSVYARDTYWAVTVSAIHQVFVVVVLLSILERREGAQWGCTWYCVETHNHGEKKWRTVRFTKVPVWLERHTSPVRLHVVLFAFQNLKLRWDRI